MKIDWNNLFKLRIANSNEGFQKHEIVKLLLMMKLIEKHKKERAFIRLYTEFPIEVGRKCDIYFEDMKKKAAYSYEIQKNISNKWKKETLNAYKDWDVFLMKTSNLIIVPLKDLSDDINELNNQLDNYIF